MKTITIAALFLTAVSIEAATVEIHENVRAKTPENMGVPPQAASKGVRAFREERSESRGRAKGVFERNPVAGKVRTRPPAETENERAVRFRNDAIEFEISKAAGAEILLDLDRYAKREAPKRTVDDRAIERYAREYIREQMPDVAPGEIRLVGVKKIMSAVAEISDSGAVETPKSGVANYIAIFQRRIDNVPVLGPGEKIRVYFSTNGVVIGHSKVWRSLDPAPRGARPVIPPGQVRDRAAERLKNHPAARVDVDLFEFGYLGHGRYVRQETLDPVYLVGYTAGPGTKRVIEIIHAHTGEPIAPPPDPPGADERPPDGDSTTPAR